jgi:hypothetical protein
MTGTGWRSIGNDATTSVLELTPSRCFIQHGEIRSTGRADRTVEPVLIIGSIEMVTAYYPET